MNKRSKVAFIFSQFPAFDETFSSREMNGLLAAGLEFEIYSLKTLKDNIVGEEAKELAQVTSYLPFFSLRLLACDLFFLFRYPGRYLSAFFQALFFNLKSPNFFLKTCTIWYKSVGFARLAREKGVTHVHGQWATYPATVAFIISKLNNIPFSFTGHAHDIYLDTTMLAFKMKRAKFIVTCTQNNKKYLLNLVAASSVMPWRAQASRQLEQKIVVNYHGLDPKKFRSDRPRENAEGRKFKILSVGSLFEGKGFRYLLEACRILREGGLKFECTIAGGGPLKDSLESEAFCLKVEEYVNFTGYVPQEKLISLYKEADVFVLVIVPDKHWGIANVLVEAAAAGVPVVCTMLASIPELIEDGKTGFIVPHRDPAAIALAIEKLYINEDLRRQVGEAARKVVEEKFDIVKNAQRLKELFEN